MDPTTTTAFDSAPELADEFSKETRTPAWRDGSMRMYSDDQLERWRDRLTKERDAPQKSPSLTPGGAREQHVHERVAQRRERTIRAIDTELLHRLMKEVERGEGMQRDNGQGR